eukprot:m.15388 g.15388  ORF g.15388 m.15388 type:complete len:52 (-) comp4903_c0_seq1:2078-2233(-)
MTIATLSLTKRTTPVTQTSEPHIVFPLSTSDFFLVTHTVRISTFRFYVSST